MFNTLLKMWKNNKLTEAQVQNAFTKGWITSEQVEIILGTAR